MAAIFRVVMILIAITSVGSLGSAAADELCNKSSALLTAEIEGLGAPDAKFVIASVNTDGKGLVEQITKDAAVGDQGSSSQLAQYRSTGCSTGCSDGCSNGCSNGCSVGCSVGCR